MASVNIVIPDDDPPYYDSAEHPQLRRLEAYGKVIYHGTRFADRAEFFRRIEPADVILNVRGYSKFDEEGLAAAPRLKMISIVGRGTDNVDLAAAKRRGVVVSNTPGTNHITVVETALGLMLAVMRKIPISDRRLREGTWREERGPELYDKTLGVLGLGIIGARMAELGRALGMRVIAWSFTHDLTRAAAVGAELVERDEVFRQADVVSVHVLSTAETHGFVGRRELALMKPTAYLINTARGAVVDADALRCALLDGRIAGAGLDVHVPEPLPLKENRFADLDNVVITPHLGGSSWEAVERMRVMTVENAIAFLKGRPVNVVNQ
jgi:phosphoglycerate dehydrogenase-like enzyme